MSDYSLNIKRISSIDSQTLNRPTAQILSDVYDVAMGGSASEVCLTVDAELASSFKVRLFQRSANAVNRNQTIFSSGSESQKRILAQIRIRLEADTSNYQVAIDATENTTIHNISIERKSCPTSGKIFQPLLLFEIE